MLWLLIGLGSHTLWGTVNILDKYIVGNHVKNVFVYFLLTNFVGLSVLAIIPFTGFVWPTWAVFKWIIVAGIGYTLGVVCYYKALEVEEISRINIWWNMIPIFTFLIAWLVLDEWLNVTQLGAIGLLIVGSILASFHFGEKLKIAKGFLWMLLACLESAVYAVIIRYVTQAVPFGTVFILTSVIRFLVSLFLFLSANFRKAFISQVKLLNLSNGSLVVSAAVVDYAGILLNQWALFLAPAALVLSLEGYQAVFVLGVSVLISRFRPAALREQMDRKNIILKLAATILVVIGIVILGVI